MLLSHYRKVFLIRFLGYVFIFIGVGTTLQIVEPVFADESGYWLDKLFNVTHTVPRVVTSAGTQDINSSNQSFGNLVFGRVETIIPVDTDFGVVVEKINANARVIDNVDAGDERSYVAALGNGIAHARGSAYPGEKGNIYLFSHSIDAPWNVVRYNAIFYLLSKMEPGDRVLIFYKGKRFDYIVYDKTIASPTDTHFLTDTYDKSVLTLQTCDPPGTLANRLIVRAKLEGE